MMTAWLRRKVRLHQQPQFRGRQGKGGRTHLVSPLMAPRGGQGRFADRVRWPDTKRFH